MIPKKITQSINPTVADRDESLTLIDRDAMKGLSSMHVDGELRNLGIVKNFRDNQEINRYLPKNISISWTHLDPNETLDTHRHPIASLIIAIEGDGESKGDTTQAFQGGEALLIPAWNEHGFSGTLPDGFWALSIQFNEIAIFENEIDPLTVFDDADTQLPPLEQRQIKFISRALTQTPNTFKSDEALAQALPDNVDFAWHQVTAAQPLPKPEPGKQRLVIVASGDGQVTPTNALLAADQLQKITAGDAFWQHQNLILNSREQSNLWLLLFNVETSHGDLS